MSMVIIPAYKPDETLERIVKELEREQCRVLVVDDGSGEEYHSVFERLPETCMVLHHTENQGKGAAIKTALRYMEKTSWEEQAIGVMDADGQHRPEDMLHLLEIAEHDKESLVLGVRKIGKEMPLRSRLGNRITRTVFRGISGKKVSDTQTGLRAFDSGMLGILCCVRGERYEYEMNVLLAAAQMEIPIKEVPIATLYKDKMNSTSHFCAVKDSFRIYKDLFRFALSSLSAFFVDYLLFLLFLFLFPSGAGFVLAANISARVISALYNYWMNCQFVFRVRRQIRTATGYFVLAGMILVLNNVVLETILKMSSLPVYAAKLITEGILFVFSWTIQRGVIFRKKNRIWQQGKLRREENGI